MAETIEIRRAGPADAEAVRDLTRAAYARWVPIVGREPVPMQADYAAAVRRDRVDLLLADGALAGLVHLVTKPDHLLIESVALAPARQGRGFGHRLLAHAEAVARAAGLDTLRLYTNALMAANIRLYESLGYRIDRTEDLPGRRVVFMSKTLPPAPEAV